jgi:hypothetical protein
MINKLMKTENFVRKLRNLGSSLPRVFGEGGGCAGGRFLILFIELPQHRWSEWVP